MTDQPHDPRPQSPAGGFGDPSTLGSGVPPAVPSADQPGGTYGASQSAPPPSGSYGPPPGAGYVPPGGGYQSGSPGGGGGSPAPSAEAKGFFGALFDYSFNTFITPMIIKFVYVLVTIGIAIGYLVIAISLFQGSTAVGVVWLLIIGPILAVLYLALARMTLEFYLAVVRVSEDVRRAVGGTDRR